MTYNVLSGTLSLYTTTTTWMPLVQFELCDIRYNHVLHCPCSPCIINPFCAVVMQSMG